MVYQQDLLMCTVFERNFASTVTADTLQYDSDAIVIFIVQNHRHFVPHTNTF